jgi:hypothetical protein
MGLFRVRGRLTGPTGRREDVDLVVPRPLADRLELQAQRYEPVVIAGGQRASWPVAELRVAVDGKEVTTRESLLLAVDPVAKRLVPVEGSALCVLRRRS